MILVIDPGRDKLGTVIYDAGEGIMERKVLPRDDFSRYLGWAENRYEIDLVLIGDGTGSDFFKDLVEKREKKVILVPEGKSSQEARRLYFEDNPPTGWKKLVPRGLLSPSRAIDDFAAEVLLLRFLKKYAEKEGF